MDDQTYNDLALLVRKGLEHKMTKRPWYADAWYDKSIEDAQRFGNNTLANLLQQRWTATLKGVKKT